MTIKCRLIIYKAQKYQLTPARRCIHRLYCNSITLYDKDPMTTSISNSSKNYSKNERAFI